MEYVPRPGSCCAQQPDRPVGFRKRTFFDFEGQATWNGVRLTVQLRISWQLPRDQLSRAGVFPILDLTACAFETFWTCAR